MANQNVPEAFTADQVAKLTELTPNQLAAWSRTGFFKPEYLDEGRKTPYNRIYSFRDVVGLRTIAILKNKYKLSQRKLEDAAQKLEDFGYEHWAQARLFVLKSEVHIQRANTGDAHGLHSGQYAFLDLIDVIQTVKENVVNFSARPQAEWGQIENKRFVRHNQSVIAGTRIPTKAIARFAEAGYGEEAIQQEYPSLTKTDIRAALQHEKALDKTA